MINKLNKLLSIIPILPLIFAAFAMSTPSSAPSEVHIVPVSDTNIMPVIHMDGKGTDFPPMLQFFSNTQHAEITATLTAVATDTGDNNGIRWVKIYEDGDLIASKDCGNPAPVTCTLSKTVIETLHTSHSYYAKTKDLGNNVVQSETIVVEFEGENHMPQIDNFVPADTQPEINVSDILHFEVWASDIDDDTLSYSWTLDSNEVSTTSSWDYQPGINDMGNHEIIVVVSDGEDEVTQTWNVTVAKVPTTCSLSFNPTSPIIYDQQPFIASCSCTNPEANAMLLRDGQDVSDEINIPVTLAANPTGYVYVCNVNETEHYMGASNLSNYVINKAASTVNLLINGIDDDVTVVTDKQVELNAFLVSPLSLGLDDSGNSEDDLGNLDHDTAYATPSDQGILKFFKKQIQQKPKQGPYHIDLFIDGQLVAYGDHNVSYNTSFDSAGSHNITVSYSETENYSSSFETHFITVEEDTEAPIINLVDPVDGVIFNISDVTITYNVTDNLDSMLNCSIWSSTSGTWQIDIQQQTVNGSSNSWNYSNLSNGVYVWNVECQDDSNNSAFASANWMFTIDVDYEAPIITFVPPTPANDSTISVNWTFINTTITDNVAVDSVLLEWNGVNETMSGSGTNYYVNKTNLADGTYTYKVYARDTADNWNVSEIRTLTVDTAIPIHDIAIESLTLLKEVNGVNITIESSTAYLNDSVYVLALVHNLGNVNESVNITLQNNIGIIDSQIVDLDADQTDLVGFVWNANPEGWHTVKVRAEPVIGETNLADNELSQDVLVWKVCDVIDCSVFGPKTASDNYALGQPFLIRSMIQNLWNNETFKDLKVELITEAGIVNPGPWPAVQYVDLNPSQFVIANWNVTSISTGNYSITTWAGNQEYNETKSIEITP